MCIKGVPFLCALLFVVAVKGLFLFLIRSGLIAKILGAKISQFGVDIGRNLTLPCPIHNTKDVMWVREEREDHQKSRMQILENGSLFLSSVERSDAGIYSCNKANSLSDEKARMKVDVRSEWLKFMKVSLSLSNFSTSTSFGKCRCETQFDYCFNIMGSQRNWGLSYY